MNMQTQTTQTDVQPIETTTTVPVTTVVLPGDFARGQRQLPPAPEFPDFARGERTLPLQRGNPDYARGERQLPAQREGPDFARGQH